MPQSRRNPGPLPRPPIDRLLAKIKVDPLTECWLFTGRIDEQGYSRLRVGSVTDGSVRLARGHRVAYEALVGPVAEGLTLDHLCRVRHCVNPQHLEPVTHEVNVMRGEGVGAMNAAKTECIHGHPFDAENTVWRPSGKRDCRACRRDRQERWRQKQVAA